MKLDPGLFIAALTGSVLATAGMLLAQRRKGALPEMKRKTKALWVSVGVLLIIVAFAVLLPGWTVVSAIAIASGAIIAITMLFTKSEAQLPPDASDRNREDS